MDTERAFLRVHARLSGVLATVLTPHFRVGLELLALLYAALLLALLLLMHATFVGQPACAAQFAQPSVAGAQIVHVKITGIWSQVADELLTDFRQQAAAASLAELARWKQMLLDASGGADASGAARDLYNKWTEMRQELLQEPSAAAALHGVDGRMGLAPDAASAVDQGEGTTAAEVTAQDGHVNRGDLLEPLPGGSTATIEDGFGSGPGRGPLGTALLHHASRWSSTSFTWYEGFDSSLKLLLRNMRHAAALLGPKTPVVTDHGTRDSLEELRLQSKQKLEYLRSSLGDPTYIYSIEKGYLMLSEGAKVRHGVRTANISISADDSCFGNRRWQRLLVDNLVGYDTILMNSILHLGGRGFLYNVQTKALYNLNYAPVLRGVASSEPEDIYKFKCGVLITSLIIFFTTTMSVSFTLRETQARMLKFTVHLQHHARHRLPTFRLIFAHVVESLVFVPIMIGILFFLFEFFDDSLLAFMILTLVWLCELFTMISMRTRLSMQYFPRFFFLYFILFHIYFFSYTYGFSYLAFFTVAAFMQHAVLFFWSRFEVPALQSVQRRQQRFFQQQQVTGVVFEQRYDSREVPSERLQPPLQQQQPQLRQQQDSTLAPISTLGLLLAASSAASSPVPSPSSTFFRLHGYQAPENDVTDALPAAAVSFNSAGSVEHGPNVLGAQPSVGSGSAARLGVHEPNDSAATVSNLQPGLQAASPLRATWQAPFLLRRRPVRHDAPAEPSGRSQTSSAGAGQLDANGAGLMQQEAPRASVQRPGRMLWQSLSDLSVRRLSIWSPLLQNLGGQLQPDT
eukprot:SM000060S19603  [mRNA]  locus=s60:29067:34348:- [translate_table: standard]